MSRVQNYATPVNVDQVATEIEQSWLKLTEDAKQKICSYATRDIEKYHGLRRQSFSTPAMYGDVWLREAAIYQSLFVMRTIGVREWIERANLATSGTFDDNILSREAANGNPMDDTAKDLTDQALAESGISKSKECTFGRG